MMATSGKQKLTDCRSKSVTLKYEYIQISFSF